MLCVNNQTQGLTSQNEPLFSELSPEAATVPATIELNNETADAIQGGALVYHTPNDPDIILYEHANGGGRWLGVKALRAGVGDRYVGITRGRINIFNDLTSSVKVRRGTWVLYEHANYKGRILGRIRATRGVHNLISWRNDKVSSIKRIA